MHLIINWSCYGDIEFVRDEDGAVMLFESEKKATEYAGIELNFLWQVVEV
jgi:hypothetical protein